MSKGRNYWVLNSHIEASSAPCQIATALNASTYFGEDLPTRPVIEILADVRAARHGSVIFRKPMHNVLGIQENESFESNPVEQINHELNKGRPVEIGGISRDYGLHSGLVIRANGSKLKIVNWHDTSPVVEVDFHDIDIPDSAGRIVSFESTARKSNLQLVPMDSEDEDVSINTDKLPAKGSANTQESSKKNLAQVKDIYDDSKPDDYEGVTDPFKKRGPQK